MFWQPWIKSSKKQYTKKSYKNLLDTKYLFQITNINEYTDRCVSPICDDVALVKKLTWNKKQNSTKPHNFLNTKLISTMGEFYQTFW